MRWAILWAAATLFIAVEPVFSAPHYVHRAPDTSLDGPTFKVGAVQFSLPDRWVAVTPESDARVGQWRVPPPRGVDGPGGEVVAFYFGPGVGGTAKENIEAWMGTMFNAEGHPAAAETKSRTVAATKISQIVAFGTYSEVVPIAGMPPIARPNYGLIGTVVENTQGNIYWRFTGPEALITADLPLFNRVIDSVKIREK